MSRYLIGRMLQAVPTLLLMSIGLFVLLRLVPGDPAAALAGPDAGGLPGAVIMRMSDAVFAVPAVLLGISFAAALGASATTAAIAIGVATMPTFARLTRAAVMGERSKEYVLAARLLGATPGRLIVRHILPNALGPLLVQMALTMAAAVLLEAGLSFLGLGTQPPQASWGVMLSDSRQYLRQAPWYGVFPGIALTLLVLGLNSLADALRDALDPRSAVRT